MAQMMLYADDSEKKAAYRQRQREALGELDYQHNEALRKRAYRARLAGDTGADANSPVREWALKLLCDLCVRARRKMKRRLIEDGKLIADGTINLSTLLHVMLTEVALGLEDQRSKAPGLRPELDALLKREQQMRWHQPYIHPFDFACMFEEIEDRVRELAGERKQAKPELMELRIGSLLYPDWRIKAPS